MRFLALGVLMLAACGAQVGVQPGDDDPSGDGGTDSPVVPPDTQPACIQRQLFLQFEGETLTDAPQSDAKQNLASWMQNGVTSGTAPPYRNGQANRLNDIATIVNAVTMRVSGFTTVVTTRPTSGDYMMIVFGGPNRADMGSNFNFVQELDCGDQVRNDVSWVSDGFPIDLIPNAVLGSIGFGIGLTATTDQTDCMCSWDNNCSYSTTNCTYHDGITRDPLARQQCPGAPAIQDEIVEVNAAFCQ